MNIKSSLHVILCSLSFLFIVACKDAWKEHDELNINNGSDLSLKEKIANEPALSKFYEYLVATDLADSIGSHKTYTIWAPTNRALEEFNTANPGVLSDPETLKQFVRGHIVSSAYIAAKSPDTLRLKTLTERYVNIFKGHYEDITPVSLDYIAKNGVLNIIDKTIFLKESVWSLVLKLAEGKTQGAAIKSLDTTVVEDGETVIKRSPRWSSFVSNLTNPNRQYTYFVLNDAAYTSEWNKIAPYYTTTRTKPDSTSEYVTKYAMLTDLLVLGRYTPDRLKDVDTLVSVSGIKIPISKVNIENSYIAGNGIVYVVNALSFNLKDRIRGFKIEGEKPTSFRFTSDSKRSNTSYRLLRDTLGTYSDIQVYNHGVSEYYINYRVPNVHKVKYKVYSRAIINTPTDQQDVAFTQRYGIASTVNAALTTVLFTQTVSNVATVPVNQRYREVLLGEFTPTQYGTLDWRLLSAASTAIKVNTLILDYVRFEPILP